MLSQRSHHQCLATTGYGGLVPVATGEMLRCISFFKTLAEQTRAAWKPFTYRSTARGAVMQEGDESKEFYILIQGQVRMTAKKDDTDREKTAAERSAPGCRKDSNTQEEHDKL